MNERMQSHNLSQNNAQIRSNNNLFKIGTGLIILQAGSVTWRAIEEVCWIIDQVDAVTTWEPDPKRLKEQPPLRLKNLRTTNKIGSIMLAGFAYEVLYERYFKYLKSE
jgi:hypothetical protein